MNAKEFLEKLNEEQRATLLVWAADGVSFREMVELAAAAEPEGFGLRVSPGALARAVAECQIQEADRIFESNQEVTSNGEGTNKAEGDTTDTAPMVTDVLEDRLLRRALLGDDPQLSLRLLRLYDQRAARAERREWAAARSSMNRTFKGSPGAERDESNEVATNERLWKARERAFGGPDENGHSHLPPMHLSSGAMYYGPNGKAGTVEKPSNPSGPSVETEDEKTEVEEEKRSTTQRAAGADSGKVAVEKPMAPIGFHSVLEVKPMSPAAMQEQARMEMEAQKLIEEINASRPAAPPPPEDKEPAVVKAAALWLAQAKNSDAMSAYLVQTFGKAEFQRMMRHRVDIKIKVQKLKELGEM